MNVCNTHEIRVTVDDGDLLLRIDTSVVVGAHCLANAIAEANRLLAQY